MEKRPDILNMGQILALSLKRETFTKENISFEADVYRLPLPEPNNQIVLFKRVFESEIGKNENS
jgi:hypothetical protein